MESIIVHPKNQMELNALKSTLKEMGIRFEKFHTRTSSAPYSPTKSTTKKPGSSSGSAKKNDDR